MTTSCIDKEKVLLNKLSDTLTIFSDANKNESIESYFKHYRYMNLLYSIMHPLSKKKSKASPAEKYSNKKPSHSRNNSKT